MFKTIRCNSAKALEDQLKKAEETDFEVVNAGYAVEVNMVESPYTGKSIPQSCGVWWAILQKIEDDFEF